MADYHHPRNSWVGFREQTDYVTAAANEAAPAANWRKLSVEVPDISDAQESEDMDLLNGEPGTEGDVVPGAESGTITVRGPIRSQAIGYDPSAGITLAASAPEWTLFEHFLGASVVSAYDAGDVAVGSGAQDVETTAGTYEPGKAVGFGASDSAVSALGFVKSQAGTTVTMLEDMRAVPTSGDNAYPMLTLYNDEAQVTPLTWRWAGDNAKFDSHYVGSMPQRMLLSFMAKKTPRFEVTYRWGQKVRTELGGLTPVTDYQTIPPIIGGNNGRFTINLAATSNDAVDSTDVFCGVANLQLETTVDLGDVECFSGLEGIGDVKVGRRTHRITCEVPIAATDISGGKSIWETRFDNKTGFSVGIFVGGAAGQLLAVAIPNAKLVAPPEHVIVGGQLVGHRITIGAKSYSGDGASTGAGNSAIRISCG